MKHFSHPHVLNAIEVPSENLSKSCIGCKLPLFGSCYTCSPCKFYLHKSCSQLPQKSTQNKSHPQHTLTLLYPPHCNGTCDACGGESCNTIFTYNCSLCNFNIHANCAQFHETKSHDDNSQYVLVFIKQKLAEQKSANAELESIKAEFNSLKGLISVNEQEVRQMQVAAALRQQENEMYLSQRRTELSLQRIKNASDNIDFLGQIGTSHRLVYSG